MTQQQCMCLVLSMHVLSDVIGTGQTGAPTPNLFLPPTFPPVVAYCRSSVKLQATWSWNWEFSDHSEQTIWYKQRRFDFCFSLRANTLRQRQCREATHLDDADTDDTAATRPLRPRFLSQRFSNFLQTKMPCRFHCRKGGLALFFHFAAWREPSPPPTFSFFCLLSAIWHIRMYMGMYEPPSFRRPIYGTDRNFRILYANPSFVHLPLLL